MVHDAELCGLVPTDDSGRLGRGAALISGMTSLDKHREMHYVMLKHKSSKNLCYDVWTLGGVPFRPAGGSGRLLRAFPLVGQGVEPIHHVSALIELDHQSLKYRIDFHRLIELQSGFRTLRQ